MASFYQKKEGIYDPGQRFSITNISDKPHPIKWNNSVVYIIKPGEAIEVSDATPVPGSGMGDALAHKIQKEITDMVMLGEAKAEEVQRNLPYYKSPLGMQLGIPNARKPYEDRILRPLPANESSVKILSQQKAEELIRDSQKQEGVSYESQPIEFAEVPKGGIQEEPKLEMPVQPPAVPHEEIKEVTKPKGRPRKIT